MARTRARRLTRARLETLIDEAVVDCLNPQEELMGFFEMIEDNLELPFQTEILGVQVTVERVDFAGASEIVAVCRRGRARQRLPVLDLPLPSPPPAGFEWIEAYRHWCGGRAHGGD